MPAFANTGRAVAHVRGSYVPIGGIAVSPCVAQFPSADTVCQLHENCHLTAFGLRHVAIAYHALALYVAMDWPEQPAAQ